MNLFILLLFFIQLPEQEEVIKSLVQQLGDAQYIKREIADGALRHLDNIGINVLLKSADDPDPEIRLRVRKIIENYTHVVPEQSAVPFIWSLSNGSRYIMDDDGFSIDVAVEYYDRAFYNMHGSEGHHIQKTYNHDEISQNATIDYISNKRLKGLSYDGAQQIYKSMTWNAQHLHHVEYSNSYELNVPSPLMTEKLKEGEWFKKPENNIWGFRL
jgi:hypothetical protein